MTRMAMMDLGYPMGIPRKWDGGFQNRISGAQILFI